MKLDIELICRLNKDWAGAKIKRAGGQTNRNYVVEYKNRKFFVRLPWESAVIDRNIEGENILRLSQNKKLKTILPKYYLYILNKRNILSLKDKRVFNVPDGTMVSQFLGGRSFSLALFKKIEYQKKLARMFRIFHFSKIYFVNRYNVFRDEIGKYKSACKKHFLPGFINRKDILGIEQIEREAKKAVSFAGSVPTHNDFIFQNFIAGSNGRIYLLDFEYAGMNEQGGMLYDFAFLFADNFFRKSGMSLDLFEKFLKIADLAYGKILDRKKIWALAKVVPVMQIWWGLLRYFDSESLKEKEYFKDYALKRMRGILKLSEILKQKESRIPKEP